MSRIIVVAALSTTLLGCASSGRIGELPEIATGAASSPLVLIRPSNLIGVANSYYVALDGKDIFSLRSGESTQIPVPQGDHVVSVKCFGGLSPTWKDNGKHFVATNGKESYFEISPTMSCAQIEQISTDNAKAKVATTKFVSPATLSNK